MASPSSAMTNEQKILAALARIESKLDDTERRVKVCTHKKPILANLELDEVHHYIGSSVQQNDVSAYQHERALWGRRR